MITIIIIIIAIFFFVRHFSKQLKRSAKIIQNDSLCCEYLSRRLNRSAPGTTTTTAAAVAEAFLWRIGPQKGVRSGRDVPGGDCI